MPAILSECLIWDDCSANAFHLEDPEWFHLESTRAAGKYALSADAIKLIGEATAATKAHLTTWLINQRLQGVEEPQITDKILEFATLTGPLQIQERINRLLRFAAREAPTVGARISILQDSDVAYAWSESTNWQEVCYFIDYLCEMGWLSGTRFANGGFIGVVTIEGYERVADSAANKASIQAFVAMWFHESMDEAFRQGIMPAIQNAGYRSLRIDQKPDVVKIDDEIIAEIRRSRFLVADFTQYEKEARGGVYFEAGFAAGLGIPVIYTCRSDVVEYLHFDTRQYAHIVWETPEELRTGLLNRIRARIGQGPITDA